MKYLIEIFPANLGEIDIIAYDNDAKELVFLEVKSRQQVKYGEPSEAVDNKKIKHIIKTAQYYLYKNNLDEYQGCRFDVIEILCFPKEKTKIHHIKNAFEEQ